MHAQGVCPLKLTCGREKSEDGSPGDGIGSCKDLTVTSGTPIEVDCTGQQGLCNGATFAAPKVKLDCGGNKGCYKVAIKEATEIELSCGPFVGSGMNIKANDVCTDLTIDVEMYSCTCTSILGVPCPESCPADSGTMP